jgi:hypothetical protein
LDLGLGQQGAGVDFLGTLGGGHAGETENYRHCN